MKNRSLPWLPKIRSFPTVVLIESLPMPATSVSFPPVSTMTSFPPLPKTMSSDTPGKMQSLPSLESFPPTTVRGVLAFERDIVSAPSPPNSCIDPDPIALKKTLSFSLPRLTVPVLPGRRTTVSFPESPVTVASPEPVKMQSSPASPTMVPGPESVDWFSVSLPAVPVTL
jgi:hypothetical protein